MKELDTSGRSLRSRGGRPIKKVKKDSGIRVRLSKTEYFMIEQKSKQAGMRISDWFRQAAKSAKVSPRLNPEELKIFRILAGMANNLNQLTKLSHEQGLLVFQKKCRVLLDEINEIIAKLFKQ